MKMRKAGFTSPLDSVGRLVIPNQIRKQFNLRERMTLEIFTTDSEIILRKYQPTCAFCNNTDSLIPYRNQAICPTCLNAINNLT